MKKQREDAQGVAVGPGRASFRRVRALATSRAARLSGSALALLAAAPASGAAMPPAPRLGADDAKILGKDDLEFAQALSRSGYGDLAREVLAAIEGAKGNTSDDALWAGVLALDLQQDEAFKEPDAVRRGDLLTKAIEAKEEFAEAHKGTTAGDEVLNRLPDLYRGIGELIASSLQNEEDSDSESAEKLREQGTAMFERAVKALQARITSLAERRAAQDPDKPDEELEFQYMLASYNLARTYYFHSLVLETGGWEQQARLRGTLDVLLDFQLDYADQLLCYEGFIYEGLANKALGQSEDALDSFESAIRVRETYELGPDGVYSMSPEAADIVSSAVLQKMLLLSEQGDHAAAAEAAREFLTSTPEAEKTLKGLAILVQQAEAYSGLGDTAGLETAAKRLVEVDPYGLGGEKGRELLGGGSGGSLSAVETMKLAETSAGRGDIDRAVALCQDVLILARGTAEEQNLGAQAGLTLGALFARRGLLHEAATAWDGSADRYAKGKDAPDCLWRAVNCYMTLQGQEQRAYYKTLASDRMKALASRYPDHAYASMAAVIAGRQLEAEQNFARAAELFEGIAPGSAGYEEAVYRAGNAWAQDARKLLQEGKASEAKASVAKAEALLVKARPLLEEAASRTLDLASQERLKGFAFAARVSLANLYLLKGVDRAADVLALFEGVEREFGNDASKVSTAWNLRFKALQADGKVDQAIALLDAQIRSDPSARWIASGAAALARGLDARGTELRQKNPKDSEADQLWRKAASYYVLAVRGQIEGEQAIQVDDLEGVANRLFVFALHFGGVPGDVDTFVGWTGNPPTEDLLEQAVRIYEAVLPLTPSYRTLISLARTLGFLGRWQEAATRYAELFERETFADVGTKTINHEALRAKPELVYAYLEWGLCEREAGIKESDATRLARASGIFETLVLGTEAGTKLWWQSKYHQLSTLTERGEYEIADIALRSLERNWQDFDEGKYGLRDQFVRLREELSKKVIRKTSGSGKQ